jgi:hypothetical protein
VTSAEARHREADITTAIVLITPVFVAYGDGDDPRAAAAAVMATLTGAGWRQSNAMTSEWTPPPRNQATEPASAPATPVTAAQAVALARQRRDEIRQRDTAAESAAVRERRAAGPGAGGRR